ncbi:uncharacterized protein LOC111352904 [Spodoptera litura]|uniref:Uncharacterized protein LOC111352904 n=1 Tax=Spodoptera litura TaxID=69820 RepID=A0A9J7E529_SPOLT|nr:uncharacterized protein LOC111352904 [Spodoptera litura]
MSDSVTVNSSSQLPVCKCILSDEPSQEVHIPEYKQRMLSSTLRTEEYLRERRIPELIRFILAKIIAANPSDPANYIVNLLEQCMLFRSGYGKPPVLYEDRHLKAIIKSFDPGDRGWLSAGQFRRAYITLGFLPDKTLQEKIPTDMAIKKLQATQELELFCLLNAGNAEVLTEIQSTNKIYF